MTQDLGIDGYGDADLIAQHDKTAVYRCRAARFDREVVVKVVAGNGFDPQVFEREARALRAFSDRPNIARVLDAGLNASGDRYTAMEYAPRGSIADQMSAGVAIPPAIGLEMAVKTARALASVHEAGLVHGNVTPSNVLVDVHGEPLLSDIGGTVPGGATTPTVAHAAPEVLAGQRPTAASDIYSLGSTIYTILAGHEPFAEVIATPEELALWKQGRDAQPLRELGIAPRVSDIVARCMARRPSDRYASARIVAEALAHASDSPNGNGSAAVVGAVPVAVAGATDDDSTTARAGASATDTAVAVEAAPAVAAASSLVTDDAASTAPIVDDDVDLFALPGMVPPPDSPPTEQIPSRRAYEEEIARQRRRERTRRIAAVIAVVLVIALGAGAFAVLHKSSKSAAPTSTALAPAIVHHADTALQHSFPTVQLGRTAALVSQLWATSSDRRTLTATINVSNASLATLRGTLRVVIPKTVSQSLKNVRFVPQYSVVITEDPKVAYRMVIPRQGRYTVHYVVHFTKPLTSAQLNSLASDEMHALAVDAAQQHVPAPKPVAVALSVVPQVTSLVMTDASRNPTVALHTTETFDGIVLHDPVLWHSTNPTVADVDANGLVTAYARGSAVIQATVGSVTVTASVTVIDNTTTTTRATTPRTQPTTQPPPPTTPPTPPTQPATTTTTLAPTTTTLAPTTTTTLPPSTTTTTVPVTVPPVPANPDVNGDGVVGCIDVGLVADYIGTTSAAEDINGDGVVTEADVQADLADYTVGNTVDTTTRPDLNCPPP